MNTVTTTAQPCAQSFYSPSHPPKNLDTLQVKDLQPSSSTIIFSTLGRLSAVFAGAGLLGASVYAVIEAGNLSGGAAYTTGAAAISVIFGSAFLPRAERWVATVLVIGLLAGEGLNILNTIDRIVTVKEANASTITGTNDVKLAAQSRLDSAIASRVDYRNRATAAVALPGCAVNCKALLTEEAAKVEAEITAARQALDRAPAKKSATPLADRLHVEAWVLDLLAAVLASLSINVTAACLIAYGCAPGHRHVRTSAPVSAAVPLCDTRSAVTIEDPTVPTPPGARQLPPRARGVLALIHGSGGHIERASQRDLASKTGMSTTTLNRVLADLEQAGLITMTADRMTGTSLRLVKAA